LRSWPAEERQVIPSANNRRKRPRIVLHGVEPKTPVIWRYRARGSPAHLPFLRDG